MVCQTLGANSDCWCLSVECFYFYNALQLHYKYNKVQGQFFISSPSLMSSVSSIPVLVILGFFPPFPSSFEALKMNWVQHIIIGKLLSFTYLQFTGSGTVQYTCKGASTHNSRAQTENVSFRINYSKAALQNVLTFSIVLIHVIAANSIKINRKPSTLAYMQYVKWFIFTCLICFHWGIPSCSCWHT